MNGTIHQPLLLRSCNRLIETAAYDHAKTQAIGAITIWKNQEVGGWSPSKTRIEAGIPTELHNVPGACHGFDIIAATGTLGRRAIDEQVHALVRGLRPATT